MAIENYLFVSSTAPLATKLRSLSFRAILYKNIEFFDKGENNTGTLTPTLSDNPQKINGLAGITLGTIMQSIATLVNSTILGLIFNQQVGLIGIACMPILVCAGYIYLHIVMLKD